MKKQEFVSDKTMDNLSLDMVKQMALRIPGGFFIYRAEVPERILFVNDEILSIFGCRDRKEFDRLTGGTFPGMVHPGDLETVQSSIDKQVAHHDKQLDYVEYRIIRQDGEVRWVDDYGRLVSTKEHGDIYYVMMRDITEERNAREEKLRMEMELEREREMSAMKASFLFNISHDIRTPMNAIIGFTALAKKHSHDGERLEEYLDRVEESSHFLLALIDDFLEMNEIDCGQMVLRSEPCSLEEELRQTIDMFRPQIIKKELKLTVEADLPASEVYMDTLRFRRMLGNLLGNAVKFTPHGEITVKAEQAGISPEGIATYRFTVADTGIGMSQNFMKHMYEAFEREETSTKTGYAGTGLGLTITKRIIALMGGTIEAESHKGEGTTFTVEIPLRLQKHPESAHPAHGGAQEAEDSPKESRRILLVEDIDVNRILAEEILKEAGFRVESVPDGSDAVEAMKKHPPYYYDLVLMDIQMPVMNGYEATRAIRGLRRPDTDRLPIIALSANARPADRAMSLESGMNDHVAKPFDVSRLISTMNAYLESQRKG